MSATYKCYNCLLDRPKEMYAKAAAPGELKRICKACSGKGRALSPSVTKKLPVNYAEIPA